MLGVRVASIVVLTALILSGCQRDGAPTPPPNVTVVSLSSSQARAVKAVVTDVLKDPESARFREPFAAARDNDSGLIHVCGFVKARNSYGGYTGAKPFLVLLGPDGVAAFIGVGGVDSETAAVFIVCRDHGVPI